MTSARLLSPAALGLGLLLAALVGAGPAQSQTEMINALTGGNESQHTFRTGHAAAQSIDTGGQSGGYVLHSIEIRMFGLSNVMAQVTIRANNAGAPGAILHTLDSPSSLPNPVGTAVFTAGRSGFTLAANSRYHVVVERTAGTFLQVYRATSPEITKETGWSFPFRFSIRTASNFVPQGSQIMRIAVKEQIYQGRPTITGSETVGQILTASAGDISDPQGVTNASYTYQWLRSDGDGAGEAEIDGATTDRYTLTNQDVNKKIRVLADFTDDEGNAEVRNSVPFPATGNILPDPSADKGVDTATCEIVITSDTSEIAPATQVTAEVSNCIDAGDGIPQNVQFTYAWQMYEPGNSPVAATGMADDRVATVGTDQIGRKLQFVVSFTDSNGNSESITSDPVPSGTDVVASNTPASGSLGVEGVAIAGYELTGDWGNVTDVNSGIDYSSMAFQWERQSADGAVWENIASASSMGVDSNSTTSYTLAAADVGRKIRVRGNFTDGIGSSEVVYSSEYPTFGTVLATVVPVHQYRGTNAISGPRATGEFRVGERMDIDLSTIWDTDSGFTQGDITPPEILYSSTAAHPAADVRTELGQDAFDGGSGVSFHTTIKSDAAGLYIFLCVNYLDPNDNLVCSETYGPVLPANHPATGEPSINKVPLGGPFEVGQTLTAGRGTVDDDNGVPAETGFTYQWVRVDADGSNPTDIMGETNKSYTLTDDDEGKRILVRVSFMDDHGSTETRESLAYPGSGTVQAASSNRSATGAPAINGTAQVGRTLMAGIGTVTDADDAPTEADLSYQWQRQEILDDDGTWGDILGETANTYTLTAADAGKRVRVLASFVDAVSNVTETVSSLPTSLVTPAGVNNVATGMPMITGTPSFGNLQRATIGNIADADGLPAASEYEFQWSRADDTSGSNAEDITNAITNEYRVTAMDFGHHLRVTVSFTDNAGHQESRSSDWTDIVPSPRSEIPPNVTATGSPAIRGSVLIGQELTATTGDIDDDNGLPANSGYIYQWRRADDSQGTNDIDIPGETMATYTPVAADEGKHLQVVVSFTDGDGYREERSSDWTTAVLSAPVDWAITSALTAFGRSAATSLVDTVWNRAEAHRIGSMASYARIGGRSIDTSAFGSDTNAGRAAREAARLFRIESVAPNRALAANDSDGKPLAEGNFDDFWNWTGLSDANGVAGKSSFALAVGEEGGSSIVYWGAGNLNNFASELEDDRFSDIKLASEGSTTSISLGLDYRMSESMLLGFAVSRVSGSSEYSFDGTDYSGELSSSLTNLTPWFRWKSGGGTEIWGAAGVGSGAADGKRGSEAVDMDLSAQIIAFGAWNQVASFGQSKIAVKADFFSATVSSEGAGDEVDGTDAGSSRIRVAAEMSSRHTASSEQLLAYALELGARSDSGEAESGTGVDFAGEFDYGAPRSSVRVTGRGGIILFHGQEGFSETGFGLGITYDPGADTRGLQLSLQPKWNAPRSNSADAMWNANSSNSLTATSSEGAEVEARVGYGLNALSGSALTTLYGSVRVEDEQTRLRFGSELLGMGWGASGLRLDSYGEVRYDRTEAERLLMIESRIGF